MSKIYSPLQTNKLELALKENSLMTPHKYIALKSAFGCGVYVTKWPCMQDFFYKDIREHIRRVGGPWSQL